MTVNWFTSQEVHAFVLYNMGFIHPTACNWLQVTIVYLDI